MPGSWAAVRALPALLAVLPVLPVALPPAVCFAVVSFVVFVWGWFLFVFLPLSYCCAKGNPHKAEWKLVVQTLASGQRAKGSETSYAWLGFGQL